MYLRKRNNKWQCLVKVKGSRVAQTFMSKWDARKWGEKTTSELRTGTWQNNNKLVSMRLKDLLQLYLEKALPRTVDGIFFSVRSVSAFEKSFRAARKRASIKDFRIHDLRHSGSRYLIEEKNFTTMELMQQPNASVLD